MTVSQGADNHVDTRPEEYTSISLCTGYGGIEIALREAVRISTLCYVEIGVEVCEILVNLMEQELIDEAPIWSDLTNFPVDIFRDRCDILQGGFPCQPFSFAGKRLQENDPRNLWPSVARIIRGVRPSVIFLENVPGILPYYFDTIRPELSEMGYVVSEGLFSASVDGGAPQKRQRLFILAYSPGTRMQRRGMPQHLTDYLDELALSDHGGHLAAPIGRGQQGEIHDRGEDRENNPGQPERVRSARDASQPVADTGSERGEGRELYAGDEPEASGRGQTGASRSSGEANVADTEGSDARPAHQEGVRGREPEDEIGSRSSIIRRPEGELGDTSEPGLQGEEHRIPRDAPEPDAGLADSDSGLGDHEEEEVFPGGEPSESGSSFPLFPPEPNDARGWQWVLSRWPQLSPTYCKEGHDLQPDLSTLTRRVRGVVDGPATGLDKRLRAVGNGVVPITCALAFHTLGRGRIF